MNKVLEVKNITKVYKIYDSNINRLKELFTKKQYHKEFVANKDISFDLYEGETLGIIGVNGAGKSTLLKQIVGVVEPTSGQIIRHGRVTALLELGTGFNPEMLGIDNIYLNGTLIGMSKKEIDLKLKTIIDFTELKEHIYDPIKTYSSGMQMRLAFSIAAHSDPKILIIDEALSVGDAYFQQKSMKKIFDLKNRGVSIIFVSHDINSVKMLCNTAILLDNGVVIDIGEPKEIINFYQNIILSKSHQGDIEYKQKKKISFEHKKEPENYSNSATTGEVELLEFSMKNEYNEEVKYITSETILKICYTVKALKDLEEPHYGVIFRNKYGISAFETSTYTMNEKTFPIKKLQIVEIEFIYNFNLSPGDYSISIGVANKGFDRGSYEEYLLFLQDIEMIKVIENSESILYAGFTNLKPSVLLKLNKEENI